MASEVRKITIEIISQEEKPKTQIEEEEDGNEQETKKTKKSNVKKTKTEILVNQAYHQLKQEVISNVDYVINQSFELHDNYIGQRTYTATKTIVSRAKSIGVSIAAGYSTAGLVGAAVMGAISVASTAVDIAKNYHEEKIALNQVDYQLSYSRLRAGYSLTSESIGENK